MQQRILSGLLGLALFPVFASAQTLTLGSNRLTAGQTLTISYTDSSRAFGEVVVIVDDGEFPQPNRIEIVIRLDGNGKGTTTWTVPAWSRANFNAPKVSEQSRPIR